MIDYRYADKDGDKLAVWTHPSTPNTAVLSADGGIYIPADEAPKTAQAILNAAGVQGSVVVGELPKVSETHWGDFCVVNGNTISCDLKYLDRAVLDLLAVKAHVQVREAEREAGLAKVREDADRLMAEKKAHDDLRTSPIALKALALYNRGIIDPETYKTWDETNHGMGSIDSLVRIYIRRAEAEEVKEKEAAEKLAERRNKLVRDHVGCAVTYSVALPSTRSLVDRVIELEDAQ